MKNHGTPICSQIPYFEQRLRSMAEKSMEWKVFRDGSRIGFGLIRVDAFHKVVPFSDDLKSTKLGISS